MKAFSLSLLLALCLGTAAAQDCPVTIEKIGPRYPMTRGIDDDPWHLYLFVKYTNASAKPIAAVRFSVAFSDIISASVPAVWDYTDESNVKPGKHKEAFWADGVYTHNLDKQVRAMIRLKRVVFTDGTSWERSSDASCRWAN